MDPLPSDCSEAVVIIIYTKTLHRKLLPGKYCHGQSVPHKFERAIIVWYRYKINEENPTGRVRFEPAP